jgi:hypothetical protein
MASPDRQLPDDPLAFIQACVRARRIAWTYHVNMRLQGRYIPRQVIFEAVDTYEIVEAYPQDQYLLSSLVLAHHGRGAFHALCATDVAGDHVRVVTAYRPSADAWEAAGKTRRTRR